MFTQQLEQSHKEGQRKNTAYCVPGTTSPLSLPQTHTDAGGIISLHSQMSKEVQEDVNNPSSFSCSTVESKFEGKSHCRW